MSTLFRKGILREARKSRISPFQAKKIQRSLEFIRSTPTQELLKSSNIVKIDVPGRNDVYLYRAGIQQRIVLSISNEEKIVHSIVDASHIKNKC